jgi:hypothetical protein
MLVAEMMNQSFLKHRAMPSAEMIGNMGRAQLQNSNPRARAVVGVAGSDWGEVEGFSSSSPPHPSSRDEIPNMTDPVECV